MPNLYESPSGFLANIPGAESLAGGALSAAGGGGIPWAMIIPILGSLFEGLFSESEEDKRQREMIELDQMMRQMGMGKYSWREKQSQQLSPVVLQAIINNMKRMGNWGYPSGMGIDWSFLQQALPNMGAIRPGGLGGGLDGGEAIKRAVTPGLLRRP